MNRTISILSVATVAAAFLAAAVPSLAQGQPERGQGPAAKRAECRLEADRKGLVGPARRAERQIYMQRCVHGAN